MKIIDVLKLVAYDRLQSVAQKSSSIQVSAYFMFIVFKEIAENESSDISIISGFEIACKWYGAMWNVYERSYRDDSNDADVEQKLYNLIKSI